MVLAKSCLTKHFFLFSIRILFLISKIPVNEVFHVTDIAESPISFLLNIFHLTVSLTRIKTISSKFKISSVKKKKKTFFQSSSIKLKVSPLSVYLLEALRHHCILIGSVHRHLLSNPHAQKRPNNS